MIKNWKNIMLAILMLCLGLTIIYFTIYNSQPIECPIIFSNATETKFVRCDFDEESGYCQNMGCEFGRYSCGRPACYC